MSAPHTPVPAHAIGILQDLGIPDAEIKSALTNTSVCPICHHTELCRYDAFPLLPEGKCCAGCHISVTYTKQYHGFLDDVRRQTTHLQTLPREKMMEGADGEIPATILGLDHTVHLRVASKIHTLPEKYNIQYACGITSYFNTVAQFVKDRVIGAKAGIFTDDCEASFKRKMMASVGSALMASFANETSTGVPSFELRVDGTISTALLIKHTSVETYTGVIIKLNYFAKRPMFVIKTVMENADVFKNPLRFHLNDDGFCDSIHFADGSSEPIEFADTCWLKYKETKLLKQQERLKQQEQERKEQERKERKERQREEQRQRDHERHEQEKALRLARASLVEAVAEVDTQLETIRKLRELNREVALKNQKLADRKEADRLAKDAERRHAEKLKQKELERQKFITKKN
jgi:hypothetical protein